MNVLLYFTYVLKMFLNLLGVQCFKKSQLREYKVGHRHNTWDFVSPDDFDDVEVIFFILFYLQDFHSQCLQHTPILNILPFNLALL